MRKDEREHLNHFRSSRMMAETALELISRSRKTSTSASVGAGFGSSSEAMESTQDNDEDISAMT